MGYTHYWTQRREFTEVEWMHLCATVAGVLAASDVPLAHEYDAPKAPIQIDGDTIRFNGVGDDGHETFELLRQGSGFQICKTDRKPYDKAVTAVLILADNLSGAPTPALTVTSDGGEADWADGLQLARLCLSDARVPVDVIAKSL